MAKSRDVLINLIKIFEAEFDITGSDLNVSVGMKISRSKDHIFIGQEKHINKILQKFGMNDANAVKTPSDPHMKLTKPKGNSNFEAPIEKQLVRSCFWP